MSNPRISLARQRFNERRRESLLTRFAEQIVLPIVVAFGAGVLVAQAMSEAHTVNLACDEAPYVTAGRWVVVSVFGDD